MGTETSEPILIWTVTPKGIDALTPKDKSFNMGQNDMKVPGLPPTYMLKPAKSWFPPSTCCIHLASILAQQEHRAAPLHLDFALNYLIVHISICQITILFEFQIASHWKGRAPSL